MAKGSFSRIIIGEETTWGTPATSYQLVYFLREGFQGNIDNIVDETISSRRAIDNVRGGRITVDGSLEVNLSSKGSHVTLIKHALGSISTTQETDASGNPTGWYIHVIKGADSLPEGLTVEKGFLDINQYFLYTGCKVSSMSIECDNDGLVRATFNFMAKDEQNSTTSVSTAPTDNGHLPFTYWEGTIEIDGVAVGNVSSFSLNVDNQMADEFFIGDRYRGTIVEGKRQTTGSLQAYFNDNSLYNKFRNEQTLSLRFRAQYDANNYIEIFLPQCKLTGTGAPVIDGAGVIYQNFDYQAFYDSVEGTDIIITVKNQVASP